MGTANPAETKRQLPLGTRMMLRLLAHLGAGAAFALFLTWPLILLAGWRA
ncbi:hypothetical protein KZC52_16065 [Microbacterium sp. kSW2-24]|nr:hypothetical protein [Microbacterium galbinum]MCK2024446.1 hypothetical protein [Microbacterium galbinum]